MKTVTWNMSNYFNTTWIYPCLNDIVYQAVNGLDLGKQDLFRHGWRLDAWLELLLTPWEVWLLLL